MGKNGLEGFSDGVIAVMVPELKVRHSQYGYHPSIVRTSALSCRGMI
jgi:hypothetical protein